MKKMIIGALLVCLCVASVADAQDLDGFSLPWLGNTCADLKFKPYAQVGFQHMGANISLPVSAELVTGSGDLQIDTLSISLQDANFWTGNIGFSLLLSDMYSLFAAAGGNLDRQFITSGLIPVSVDGAATSASIDFTTSGLKTWFIQTGVGLGPVLVGLYWDKFTATVADPRTVNGPLANQTLKGDVVTTTFCPFVGFALPVSTATLTVMYSPLAWADSTIALRSSYSGMTDLQYKWNKPGALLSGTFQYNAVLSERASFGVWTTYTWMNQRGNCTMTYEHNNGGTISRDKGVTAEMAKYVLQGGFSLGLSF